MDRLVNLVHFADLLREKHPFEMGGAALRNLEISEDGRATFWVYVSPDRLFRIEAQNADISITWTDEGL